MYGVVVRATGPEPTIEPCIGCIRPSRFRRTQESSADLKCEGLSKLAVVRFDFTSIAAKQKSARTKCVSPNKFNLGELAGYTIRSICPDLSSAELNTSPVRKLIVLGRFSSRKTRANP